MAQVVMDVLTMLDERSALVAATAIEAQFSAAGKRAGAAFAAEITGAQGLAGVRDQAERHGMAAGVRFATGLVDGVGHTDMKGALTSSIGKMVEEGGAMGAATGAAIAAGVLSAFATLGIEVGEKFAAINRDITINSAASGAALDELKSHADALVGSLDTAANKVGADMATIAQRLHMGAGEELDNITRHVEILRDRVGSFDTGQFSAALAQMNVPAAQVDSTLASLLATSQQYGGNILPELVSGLAQYGTVFNQLHISMQQAAAMEGEMIAKGVPMQQGMAGIEAAAKAWIKPEVAQGRTFDQFIRDAATSMQYYAQHGEEAKAQEIAIGIFAQRRWAQAMQAAQAYNEVVKAGPDAFNQSPENIDKFAEETRTLRNEWDHLKNSLAQALAPTGETLVSALGHVVDVLAKIPGLVEFVAGSFGAWAVISGVSKLTSALGVIVTTMRTQVPAAAATSAAATEAASVSMAASLGRVSIVIGGIIAGMEIAKKTWPTISHLPGAGIASPQGLDWVRGQLGAGPKVEAPWNMSDDEAWHRGGKPGDKRPETATPGAPGGPGPGGAPSGLIDPNSLLPGAGKVPAAPQIPYSADYGQPPLPGETPEHYRARQDVLSKQHDLEEKRARVTQLEHDNNAKQDDVVKARNEVLDAERAQQEATLSLYGVEHSKTKPAVAMPSGFGMAPRVGQTSQQYQAEQGYYESQGKSAEARARLSQVEADSTATAEDLINARNELAAAEHNEYDAQMRLHDAYVKTTETTDELGAKLDNDFGISKGLPGIVENVTKALANLTMAPVLGALGAIGSNSNVPKGAGGLIGMAAISGAFGPNFTGIPRSGGAGPGGSFLPPGASYGPGGYPNGVSQGGFGPGSSPAGTPDWAAIAQKESSGNWRVPTGQGTADNPVSGGLQIGDKTWADYGGLQFGVSRAYQATPEQQLEIAKRIYGGWNGKPGQGAGAWPNTFTYSSGGGGAGPGNPPAAAGPQAAARPGQDPREFAHSVMEPYWESMGLKVGDHAADKYGEHQHGALDVMIPNLAVGQQVVQQALQDPNVQGMIFNNQTYGYGHGATPQDYSAGHTGDPSQDHQNHVHIWYQPGNPGNIKPGTPGVPGMPSGLGPGAASSGASFGGDGSIPIPLPVTIVGGGGDILGGGAPIGAGPGAAPGPGAPPGAASPGATTTGSTGTGATARPPIPTPGLKSSGWFGTPLGPGNPHDPDDNRPGGGGQGGKPAAPPPPPAAPGRLTPDWAQTPFVSSPGPGDALGRPPAISGSPPSWEHMMMPGMPLPAPGLRGPAQSALPPTLGGALVPGYRGLSPNYIPYFGDPISYDDGGMMPPGQGSYDNSTGRPEVVAPVPPSQPSALQGQQTPESMGPGGKAAGQQGMLGMLFSALGNQAMGGPNAPAPDPNNQQGATRIGGVEAAKGTGKGFGGINEELLSAAAGAAGPMGLGAQMGLKLANRAIAFGGQAAGAIAKGAIETWLPAGASQLAQNNWATRILGGVVGAHPQIPNMAGKPAAGPLAQPGPTPESIAVGAFPDAPKGGSGPPPGPAAPMVNIEHYHVEQTEDHAGKDLARHQIAGSPNPSIGR